MNQLRRSRAPTTCCRVMQDFGPAAENLIVRDLTPAAKSLGKQCQTQTEVKPIRSVVAKTSESQCK